MAGRVTVAMVRNETSTLTAARTYVERRLDLACEAASVLVCVKEDIGSVPGEGKVGIVGDLTAAAI